MRSTVLKQQFNSFSEVRIVLKSSCNETLGLYSLFLEKVLNDLDLSWRDISLPVSLKRLTILKSPHVYKKAKESFEVRGYKKMFIISSRSVNLINLLRYVVVNRPRSIKMKIYW